MVFESGKKCVYGCCLCKLLEGGTLKISKKAEHFWKHRRELHFMGFMSKSKQKMYFSLHCVDFLTKWDMSNTDDEGKQIQS